VVDLYGIIFDVILASTRASVAVTLGVRSC